MKNNKFNKEWTPFCIGCALAAICGIVIATIISLRTPIYEEAYKGCKKHPENDIPMSDVVDCGCFAHCWERIYKTGVVQNYADMLDTTDLCMTRCVRI